MGTSGGVATESSHMLMQSNLTASKFDLALLGLCPPFTSDASIDLLVEISRVLKPSGEIVIGSSEPDSIVSNLRLSGYSDVAIVADLNLTDEQKAASSSGIVKEITARKPNFEVGSAMPLSFVKQPSALNVVAEELMDPDDLLTEEDKVKPDAASLKVI